STSPCDRWSGISSGGVMRRWAGASPARPQELTMTDTKIRLDDVSKSFEMAGGQSLEVLRDISFEVRDGDFVAVLGPSGSGKSTLLGILSGIQGHDHGTLEVPPPE